MSHSSIPDTSTELQFLSSHVMWNMYLMVYRPDGSPTGYPMLAAYHDGSLEFTTKWLKAGFQMVTLGSDAGFMRAKAGADLAAARGETKTPTTLPEA